MPVGFPVPGDGTPADHIFITKTDFADVLVWIDQVKAWVSAADACLQSQSTFADSLNSFIRAGQ